MSDGRAFPRSRRILRRDEYRQLYRDGLRVGGRWMVLFGRVDEGGVSRLGVTASRKVGNAVVRNRCKRRVRELFRLHHATGGASPLCLVVNVRRGLDEAVWMDLEQEFRRCVRVLRSRLG